MSVTIYLIRSPNGIEDHVWLCPECLAKRQALRWEVVKTIEPPHRLLCEDCET